MTSSRSTEVQLLSRRRVLGMVGIATVFPLAGCLGDDNGEGELPLLADVLQWETGYVMVHGGGPVTGSGTVHAGDFHSQLEFADGTAMEVYRIGTDLYIISDGDCLKTTDQAGGGLFDGEQVLSDFGETQASERTTIGDEDVYLFEVNGGYFYVSVESGYPVLMEDPETGVSLGFHSWSQTAPISPPDIECVSA